MSLGKYKEPKTTNTANKPERRRNMKDITIVKNLVLGGKSYGRAYLTTNHAASNGYTPVMIIKNRKNRLVVGALDLIGPIGDLTTAYQLVCEWLISGDRTEEEIDAAKRLLAIVPPMS